jgi:hypothetical protein
MHRQNIAERAIQTYKGHFIATMAGVLDDFLIHQWHELVPQIVLTLNLLRQSHVSPNVLAYAYHHGNFDYNRMPLAPMGCAVQFHIKSNRCKSWGEHSSNFKHKHITQPTLTTEDLVIKAIQDLSNAIKGGKILVAIHKSKQSLDSPMRSDLGTNCHSMPVLQGCRLMHLQGCSLLHLHGCSLTS